MRILIPALALGVAAAGCSSTIERSPEEQAGYFVDVEQSQARGGVGNYVDESAADREGSLDSAQFRSEDGSKNIHAHDRWEAADQEVAAAPTEPAAESDELTTAQAAPQGDDPQLLVTELRDDLYFEFGKAELKTGAVSELEKLGDALSQKPDSKVVIEGHADAIGSDTYNRDLSRQRAESVRQVLASRGVRNDQIEIRELGESKPTAPNDTDQGRAQNRRVDLNLG